MDDEHDVEYELELPFVCCGVGGYYEDADFVAGWKCAEVYMKLSTGWLDTLTAYGSVQLAAQLDLIAMKFNYKMTEEKQDGPDLIRFDFGRAYAQG
jgi:hypothetical protein